MRLTSPGSVARLLAGVGAAVSLVVVSVHSVDTTRGLRSAAVVSGWTELADQTACLRTAVRQAVPRGASVWIGSPTTVDSQRLAEVSTLWAVPTLDRADARWSLRLVQSRVGCEGLRLEAERTA